MSTAPARLATVGVLALGVIAGHRGVEAATVAAASCSQLDVQAAVDRAAVDDTVTVPAGACAWSEAVAWRNENLQLLGAGAGQTVITCQACLSITSDAMTSEFSRWRVSGFTFQGDAPSGTVVQIWDNVGPWKAGWRFDHNELAFPGAGSGYGIFVGGVSYGLIDNNVFRWGNGLAIINVAQQADEYPATITNLQGAYAASLPLDMGTEKALYIEDNQFESTAPGGCAAYDTSSGGGRAVFRHNEVVGCLYYSHWTRTLEIGGVLHEIYRNRFVGNDAYRGYPIRLEAGTGAIFDNTSIGFDEHVAVLDERRGFVEADGELGACDGSKAWDGNAGDAAAPGWPCLGQIGRAPGKTMAQLMAGDKQESAPLYFWNNGVEEGCQTGGACTDSMTASVYDGSPAAEAHVRATPHPNGEVDYVLSGATPKPGYTPYAYPHPLRGEPLDAGEGDEGCGCRARGGGASAWLVLVALGAVRRRRAGRAC